MDGMLVRHGTWQSLGHLTPTRPSDRQAAASNHPLYGEIAAGPPVIPRVVGSHVSADTTSMPHRRLRRASVWYFCRMRPALPGAPIDEVVAGFVFDRAIGPDAVESGIYLGERAASFSRHEIHEPVIEVENASMVLPFPAPTRTWLVSSDNHWLVQLQHDRFHANWRRLTSTHYPGFAPEGGIMDFALREFAQLQDFCRHRRDGAAPQHARVDVTKIDLLLQGTHWHTMEDAYTMLPAMKSAQSLLSAGGSEISLQTQEVVEDVTLTISVAAARLRAEPDRSLFRVEFRAVQTATGGLRDQLLHMNNLLNEAFWRLIPDAETRFK